MARTKGGKVTRAASRAARTEFPIEPHREFPLANYEGQASSANYVVNEKEIILEKGDESYPSSPQDAYYPHHREFNRHQFYRQHTTHPKLEERSVQHYEFHYRDTISDKQWWTLMIGNSILTILTGYDVSNVANVQISIYEAFGKIELLPWVNLSYSLVNAACIPLARKLATFCELRSLMLVNLVILAAGSALCGAAPNMECIIVGRALMAIGCAIIYQCLLIYNTTFSRPHELAIAQGSMGACFAIGLIVGPILSGVFAETEHATWRWAFYIVLPVVALVPLFVMFYPKHTKSTNKPISQHLAELDYVGCILHMALFVLFGMGSVFSGSKWAWNSAASKAVWALVGIIWVVYVLQQKFSVFTTPDRRILPVSMFYERSVVCLSIGTIGVGIAYGVTLYYTPYYFAFTHGRGALDAAILLLPFIGTYIGMAILGTGLLPRIRYYMPVYVFGAACIILGAILLQTISPTTSESRVMGFESLIGAGLGLLFQLPPTIMNLLVKPEQRADALSAYNLAQFAGISCSLAMAGSVYQNVGFQLVETAVAGNGYSSDDIRSLLAGADSPISKGASAKVLTVAIVAVTETLKRCYFIALAGGVLCLLAAFCMKAEPLNFQRPENPADVGMQPVKETTAKDWFDEPHAL